MNLCRTLCLAAAATLLAGGARAAADAHASPYEPLAFLVGHCWKGTFPGSQVTDEHCFSWVYEGKFVRDRHVVHAGADKPDALGESIYLWDSAAQQLQYLYIESAGGFSRGTVAVAGATLIFPPTPLQDPGAAQTYRSRWQRVGEDAYEVITEFEVKGAWKPGFSVHMQRVKS
jgi:hypothetical protein